MQEEIQKRYYTIGEVAEKFNVNTSLIRFWETEFDILRPKKNKKGDRQFTQKDIDCIQTIYHLVKEKGYTLQGAKDIIKASAKEQNEKAALIASLEKIKSFLIEVRNNLDVKDSNTTNPANSAENVQPNTH
ncbi:MerR family transcriptional regulator [Rhodocytophaga aerolata]|uniref:MerR family transcriptional regulator n=1 Tax=Rhodocytophaga aerolata TaxID=455078 RepID=A0ABT8R0Y2_9BACT|nr:MerR family transcriptional regulator [Rhodocytophaga aerolata]MDO1444913.1 MerR family transcriptional regulator [Rhodocytophaga aerolata]